MRTFMKKLLICLFVLFVCIGLTACGNSGETAKSSDELEVNPETGKKIVDFSNKNVYIVVKSPRENYDRPEVFMNGINTPVPKKYLGQIEAVTIKDDDDLFISFEIPGTIQYGRMRDLFSNDEEYEFKNDCFIWDGEYDGEAEYFDPSNFTVEEILEQLSNYTDDKIVALGFNPTTSSIEVLIEKTNDDGSVTYYCYGTVPYVLNGQIILELGTLAYGEDDVVTSYEEGYSKLSQEGIYNKKVEVLYVAE